MTHDLERNGRIGVGRSSVTWKAIAGAGHAEEGR